MGRRPAPEAHALAIRVPRGQDGFWQVIRELDKKGPWSVGQVDGRSNVEIATVRDFVRRLVKAGIAVVAGQTSILKPSATLYRLVKRPTETPRLRRDGSAVGPTGQQQMWVAMRRLQQFDAAELALAATTDETRVDPTAARFYIVRLHAAGYLAMVAPGKTTGGRAIWRLKPAMDTGPKAPQVMRTQFIFDPNRGAVMGGPVMAQEARS
ncbi:hypothetical protein RA307_31905 [Xanthobacteraceae bacterium Astr-EGSB]|uniref:hypothetical protein n=1 Tax=Astrobacterium formosum TaxID=3069710 RepID=UPI0027AF6CCD|nr:hypothetical protein [Xanthobacteraceae bacterium Astr-EGSB]